MKAILLLCLIIVSGCSTLSQADVDATLVAGGDMLATDSAIVNVTALARRTEILSTVEVNETRLAQIHSINSQLGGTLIASASPTPGLVVGSAPIPASELDSLAEHMDTNVLDESLQFTGSADARGSFEIIGVSSQTDAQGCPIGVGENISTTVSGLYVGVRAFDLPSGSYLRVEWYKAGELRAYDVVRTDQYYDDRCLTFFLDAVRTFFTAGQWYVLLYYNDRVIDREITFVME